MYISILPFDLKTKLYRKSSEFSSDNNNYNSGQLWKRHNLGRVGIWSKFIFNLLQSLKYIKINLQVNTLSGDGTMFVTASTPGKIIRVLKVSIAEIIY